MRRFSRGWALALIVSCLGCGSGYDKRIDLAIAELERKALVEKTLKPPLGDKFAENQITLRPPISLGDPKNLEFGNPEDGMYDVEATFASEPFRLHFLARRKGPKPAAKKDGEEGGSDDAGASSKRGAFVDDVKALVASEIPEGGSPELKGVTEGRVKYKRMSLKATDGPVRVYFYHRKLGQEEYDAALIWEIDTKAAATADQPIKLCLENFSMGKK